MRMFGCSGAKASARLSRVNATPVCSMLRMIEAQRYNAFGLSGSSVRNSEAMGHALVRSSRSIRSRTMRALSVMFGAGRLQELVFGRVQKPHHSGPMVFIEEIHAQFI